MNGLETVRFSEIIADELESYRRTPLELSAEHATSIEGVRIALQGTLRWLASINGGDIPSPDSSRTVQAERDTFRMYVAMLKETAPHYLETIEGIANSLPPMAESCRIAVNMPAHREGMSVDKALGHMLIRNTAGGEEPAQHNQYQKVLDPRLYEVVVVSNRPEGTEEDGTAAAVKRFRDQHRIPLNVLGVDVVLPPSIANNGMARRILHDITMLRSMRRNIQSGPLYIAAEDADIDGYDRRTFETYIKYLDSHPENTAARMRTERNVLVLKDIPHLFLKHRFMTQLVSILRSADFQPSNNSNYNARFNRKVPSGYGTAFVASNLIKAGGFPITESSTDLLLGEQLAVLHGHEDNDMASSASGIIGSVPTIVLSSPRREITAYVAGVDPYGQGNFTNENLTRLTRKPLDELVRLAGQKDVSQSREWLQLQMQQGAEHIFLTAPTTEHGIQAMHRLMFMSGFPKSDYSVHVLDGRPQLTVTSWENAEQRVRDYRPPRKIASLIDDN